MILLTKFLKDLRVKPLTLAVPIRYKPYNSAIWIILTRSVFPGWWWWGSKGERHRVWLHQEDLWRDVCLGLLLALDQDSRGDILFVFLQFFPLTTFLQVLSIIVFDPFTELFITLCIVVNVLFMSADHYDVEYDGMWVWHWIQIRMKVRGW